MLLWTAVLSPGVPPRSAKQVGLVCRWIQMKHAYLRPGTVIFGVKESRSRAQLCTLLGLS